MAYRSGFLLACYNQRRTPVAYQCCLERSLHMKKVAFAFVSVLALLAAVWAGVGSGSENVESAFLTELNPGQVFKPFYGPTDTCGWGQTREGGSDPRRSL